MDLHKPKPWRGVREFLKEYLIIVVGVLTALAAESGVEWLHWRHMAEAARAAIVDDQKRMLGYIGTRDMASPCIARRLDEIEAILDRAAGEGRLPPLGEIGIPPRESWTMRGWDGIVSGQTLAHLPAEGAARFTAQAVRLQYLRGVRDSEIDDWAVLRGIRGAGRRLSDAEAADLRAALSRARTNGYRMRNAGDQLGGMVIDSGLLSKAEMAAAWRVGADSVARAPDSICHPIAPIGTDRFEDRRLTEPPQPPDRSYETALDPHGVVVR